MQGVSGSGKSSWIRANVPDAVVVSADHFFLDKEGQYNFNPAQLGTAHAECLKKFCTLVQTSGTEGRTVVVDNTNTSISEMAPYCALALAFGRPLKVVTLLCDPVKAAQRNAHGTPLKSVLAQHKRLVTTVAELPPWWPCEIVNDDL